MWTQTAEAILDVILNCTVTAAYRKGCPPGNCCWRSKVSNYIQQPVTASRLLFHQKCGLCPSPRMRPVWMSLPGLSQSPIGYTIFWRIYAFP